MSEPISLPLETILNTAGTSQQQWRLNRFTPNDPYMGRTAPLTSKRCILYIYSTNIGTEYFKHALYSPFFLSSKCSLFHNANLFGSCIIHILYTVCAEIKKNNNNSGAKGLILPPRRHFHQAKRLRRDFPLKIRHANYTLGKRTDIRAQSFDTTVHTATVQSERQFTQEPSLYQQYGLHLLMEK